LLLRVQARTRKAVKLMIKRFIGWSPWVQRYGRPDWRYTGPRREGTGELEMNACAGLLPFRSRATFVRYRLSRPEPDLLDPKSWIDLVPGWVRGSDALFREVVDSRKWGQRTRRMSDRRVLEPRLTAPWNVRSGVSAGAPDPRGRPLALSARYGVVFDSAGFNLYRDGQDSVAWHGDRIAKEIEEPIVALVSLGEPRKFLLRPRGGGKSRASISGAETCW